MYCVWMPRRTERYKWQEVGQKKYGFQITCCIIASVSSAANAFSILLTVFSFVVECAAEWEVFFTKRRNCNNVYFLKSPSYYFAGRFLRL